MKSRINAKHLREAVTPMTRCGADILCRSAVNRTTRQRSANGGEAVVPEAGPGALLSMILISALPRSENRGICTKLSGKMAQFCFTFCHFAYSHLRTLSRSVSICRRSISSWERHCPGHSDGCQRQRAHVRHTIRDLPLWECHPWRGTHVALTAC